MTLDPGLVLLISFQNSLGCWKLVLLSCRFRSFSRAKEKLAKPLPAEKWSLLSVLFAALVRDAESFGSQQNVPSAWKRNPSRSQTLTKGFTASVLAVLLGRAHTLSLSTVSWAFSLPSATIVSTSAESQTDHICQVSRLSAVSDQLTTQWTSTCVVQSHWNTWNEAGDQYL